MWTCFCGANNNETTNPDVCINGHPREAAASTPPPESPITTRHGWRLTLPNHVVVPLAEGSHHIGRGSQGMVGQVLRLFTHVHHDHLTLNVTSDGVDIIVERGKNPVFEYPEAVDPHAPVEASQPSELRGQRSLTRHDARTLCLGQCCFIRIDRGEV